MASEIKVVKFLNGVKTSVDHGSPSIDLILKKIRTPESTSNISGANAVLPSPLTSFVLLNNPALVSILNIDPATTYELLIIHNSTGVPIAIKASGNIMLGTIDEELIMEDDSSILLYHIESLNKYTVIGGTGSGGGSSQKKFPLANNQNVIADVVGLLLDATKYTSYFIRMEVERLGTLSYRQIVEFKAVYSGTAWTMEQGSYIGSDLIQPAIVNTQEISLAITAVGQVRYLSGNLAGHTKSNLKVILEGLKL